MQHQATTESPRVISVASPTSRGQGRALHFLCKRCGDVVFAAAALALISPLMLLIALLIKIDSRGPVLFVQERVGAKRRREPGRTIWQTTTFRMYKFRSMFSGADQSVHAAFVKAYVAGNTGSPGGAGAAFKLHNDPRVTRIGRILRKTSMDELPQLLNVLKGEMSLVGPRPVPPYEVAEYRPEHRERLTATPGLTGLWQVSGRSHVSFEDMVRLDIEYARHQSLLLDVKILMRTVPAVIAGLGAE